jgi:hypothetical protein
MGIPYGDDSAVLNDFKLLIKSHQFHTGMLVTNDALSDLVRLVTTVALALANDLYRIDTEVHRHSCARL